MAARLHLRYVLIMADTLLVNLEQARQYSGQVESPTNSNRSNMHNIMLQPHSPTNSIPPPMPVRHPPPTQQVEELSTLPYLQPETPRPSAMFRPPPPPFPRFVPPPQQRFPIPNGSQASLNTMASSPTDYHSQALAIVGGYPPRREEPAPYPVMMRPNEPSALRTNSMPVEAVMARYGQALPDEPLPPLPIRPPPLAGRPMSNPTPIPAHHKLMRPSQNRRTQSELPLQMQQSKQPGMYSWVALGLS